MRDGWWHSNMTSSCTHLHTSVLHIMLMCVNSGSACCGVGYLCSDDAQTLSEQRL